MILQMDLSANDLAVEMYLLSAPRLISICVGGIGHASNSTSIRPCLTSTLEV